jgi:hypothetical protein
MKIEIMKNGKRFNEKVRLDKEKGMKKDMEKVND